VTTPPVSRAAAANTANRATSDPATLVPTPTTADPPAAGPDHVTADHVTAREIADFLRDLAELRAGTRGADPGVRTAFLARKAELFTRIGADLPAPPPAEGRTP
jgi:hypothetical protein